MRGARAKCLEGEKCLAAMVVYCVVCVSATVHAPVRRRGCTGSDPGLTRDVATQNRVCERRTRPHVASVLNVYEVLVASRVRDLVCTCWCVVNELI